jgi:hypothetical protein
MTMKIILGTILGFALLAVAHALRARWLLHRRGWITRGAGRDQIEYVERGRGRIVFYAELMGRGPVNRVFTIPVTTWEMTAPAWARGRMDEIVARLKTDFPEPRNEFEET